MELSVVTTLYKSEKYINEFFNRIYSEINKLGFKEYEIIFVNDGSPDQSDKEIEKIKKIHLEVRYIELSRNFGHHNAMLAGLENARGELVFLIDVDLEEQPEWLSLFKDKMDKKKCDVVYGVQRKRDGNFLRRLTGQIWYFFLNYFIDFKHPHNITTARLMKRDYIENLKKFKEASFVMSAIWQLTGYNQISVEIEKIHKKSSSYKFSDKLEIILKMLIGYNNNMLKYAIMLNLIISTITLFYSFIIMLNKIKYADSIVAGWSSLFVLICLSYFCMSICLTFIGFYIAQINEETKNRPKYLIKNIF